MLSFETSKNMNCLNLILGREMIQLKKLMKKSWFQFEFGVPFLNILNFFGLCMHGITVSYSLADFNKIAPKESLKLVNISCSLTNYTNQNWCIITYATQTIDFNFVFIDINTFKNNTVVILLYKISSNLNLNNLNISSRVLHFTCQPWCATFSL